MQTSIIYGPPGTGKTHHLQQEVAHFPKPCLCLSFTKAGASELSKRGVGASASTLHSLAYHAGGFDSAQVVNYSKLTDLTQKTGITFSAGNFDDYATAGDEYLSLISFAKNTFLDIAEAPKAKGLSLGTPGEFSWFAGQYEKWKKKNYFIDFSDMLIEAMHKDNEGGLHKPGFGGLVIDEAQDLSPLQWKLVDRIIALNKFEKCWVAGDDDQAIFSWAGADPVGVPEFEKKYSGIKFVLGKSYRIPGRVHSLAQRFLKTIRHREEKDYLPRDEEGAVESLYSPAQVAGYDVVLYRNHSIGLALGNELKELGIPYTGSRVKSPLGSYSAKAAVQYSALLAGEQVQGKAIKDIERHMKKGLTIQKALKEKTPWQKAIDIYSKTAQEISFIEARQRKPLHLIKAIPLESIHQWKGKEADNVVVVDGMNDRTREGFAIDPDSEARVFYVAITRAKKKLGILETDNQIGLKRYM